MFAKAQTCGRVDASMSFETRAPSSSLRVGHVKESDMYIGGGAVLIIILLIIFFR
jgi:hypothetical protein